MPRASASAVPDASTCDERLLLYALALRINSQPLAASAKGGKLELELSDGQVQSVVPLAQVRPREECHRARLPFLHLRERHDAQVWLLYVLPRASEREPALLLWTVSLDGGSLRSAEPFDGTVRIAAVAAKSVAQSSELLDAHSGRIPLGGAVSARGNGAHATLAFSWHSGIAPRRSPTPHPPTLPLQAHTHHTESAQLPLPMPTYSSNPFAFLVRGKR